MKLPGKTAYSGRRRTTRQKSGFKSHPDSTGGEYKQDEAQIFILKSGVPANIEFKFPLAEPQRFFGFGLFVIFYLTLSIKLYLVQARTCSRHIKFNARALFISLGIFSLGCISASSVIYFPPMWILFGLAISAIKLSSVKVIEVAPRDSIQGES